MGLLFTYEPRKRALTKGGVRELEIRELTTVAGTMFELVEIELTRVRRMAEQAGDGFLLYLLDMAIIEANAKARASNENVATPVARLHPPSAGAVRLEFVDEG